MIYISNSLSPMNRNCYLINTRTPWEEPPRARHQIAKALAINNKVYFIAANKTGFPKIIISKIEDNLYLIQPYWFLNYRLRFRLFVQNELYQTWLFSKLSIQYNFIGFRVINFDHTAHLIFNHFRDVIYYCNDEFLKLYLAKSRFILKYYSACEKRVIRRSRFCVGVTNYIVSKLSKLSNNVFYIPLGAPNVDVKSQDRQKIENSLEQLYVAFVGFIHDGFNDLWVKELAAAMPSLKILLIGPEHTKVRKSFLGFPNVCFEGVRRGQELFRLVKKSKVCIAPYRQTRNINEIVEMPNKFWLYLACGKPVITCIIPNIHVEEPFVYQCKDEKDFVSNVIRAITVNTEMLEFQRSEFARRNSWEMRIDILEQIYASKN